MTQEVVSVMLGLVACALGALVIALGQAVRDDERRIEFQGGSIASVIERVKG